MSFRLRQLCCVEMLLVCAGCTGSQGTTTTTQPLPAIDDVRIVEAQYFDIHTKQLYRFEIPRDHLRSVFDALEPPVLDPQPQDWMVLGELRITLRNGQPFQVDLYSISDPGEPGAFSAGKTREQRKYYRGGSSSQLLNALREARRSLAP